MAVPPADLSPQKSSVKMQTWRSTVVQKLSFACSERSVSQHTRNRTLSLATATKLCPGNLRAPLRQASRAIA